MQICTLEEGLRSHWTTVIDGFELLCGLWDLNSPLEEQPALSTSESSLQPLTYVFYPKY